IENKRAYLHRSVANGLINRYRREQSFPTLPLHELSESEHPVMDGVEAAAQVSELSQALSDALGELPPACQQVFAWHRLEGWTVPVYTGYYGAPRNVMVNMRYSF